MVQAAPCILAASMALGLYQQWQQSTFLHFCRDRLESIHASFSFFFFAIDFVFLSKISLGATKKDLQP
jgi:hypothetical protein